MPYLYREWEVFENSVHSVATDMKRRIDLSEKSQTTRFSSYKWGLPGGLFPLNQSSKVSICLESLIFAVGSVLDISRTIYTQFYRPLTFSSFMILVQLLLIIWL